MKIQEKVQDYIIVPEIVKKFDKSTVFTCDGDGIFHGIQFTFGLPKGWRKFQQKLEDAEENEQEIDPAQLEYFTNYHLKEIKFNKRAYTKQEAIDLYNDYSFYFIMQEDKERLTPMVNAIIGRPFSMVHGGYIAITEKESEEDPAEYPFLDSLLEFIQSEYEAEFYNDNNWDDLDDLDDDWSDEDLDDEWSDEDLDDEWSEDWDDDSVSSDETDVEDDPFAEQMDAVEKMVEEDASEEDFQKFLESVPEEDRDILTDMWHDFRGDNDDEEFSDEDRYHILQAASKTLSVTRYTYDAWMKCYPKSNREEWEAVQRPNNFIEYLNNVLDGITSIGRFDTDFISGLSVCILDDDYFSWLKRKGKEDSEDSRTLYAYETPSDIKEKKLEESGLGYSYSMAFLDISVYFEDRVSNNALPGRLSDTTCAKLRKYLSKETGAEVYIPGYIMAGDTALNNIDKLINQAKSYFENGVNTRISGLEEPETKQSANLYLRFIPFITCRKSGAIVSMNRLLYINDSCNDFYTDHPDMLVLFEDEKAKDSLNAGDIAKANEYMPQALIEEINRHFEGASRTDLLCTPVIAEQIPEIYEAFMSAVARK